MPTQSLQHNTPTFSTRNINADSTNSLPNPYNSPILASDLMAFPAGGIKNANTLDELRRALNQLAKDKKEYLDGLQVQVTNNDGDITIIDTNLTEIQADLVNVARDLSRKAWESILIHAGTGLSGGGSIAADRTINLNVSSPNEIGGVKSATDTIAETKVGEVGINGHINVDTTTGYMKVLDNAVELGAKTRGDYIKNITATPADGITLTNGDGEGVTTDLKLTDIHSGASEQLATVTDANITGHSMPTGKIRRVTLHVPTRDKYGRITSDSPLKINSANDKNLKVLVTDGLNITAGSNLGASTSKSATFKQNKGSNQDFTINHSPAVGTLADTTFTTGIPSSGYTNYSPGFEAGTGKINFPQTLQALTFDTFGHVKQVTKRTLTYGLNSPLTPIQSSTRPYAAGSGSGFDLNVPTEADFNNLTKRVLTLQGNRVLVPTSGNIQLERDTDVTGALGGAGTLNINGNLNVGPIATPADNILKVDTSTQTVGINMGASSADRELNVKGRVKIDAGTANSMAGTIDNGYLVIASDSQTLGIDPNQIRTSDDLILQAPESNKSIQLETAAGEILRVTSTGRVGIGTGAPVKKFQVVGSSDDAVSASFSGGIEVANTVNAVNGGNRAFGFLSIDNDRTMVGGNLRLDDTVTAGTHPGYATGTNDRGGAGIIFENANDDGRGEIRFVQKNDTNDGSWNVLERVVIDSLGRVGIGTATPGARLHVKAPTPGNSNIQGSTSNTSANSPSAIFDTTVVCEGNLVVKGDFNLQNGITFDNWNLAEVTGNVTAGGLQNFTNTTESTGKTNGAVKIAGGLGVAKNITSNSLRLTGQGDGHTNGALIIDVTQSGTNKPAQTAIINLKGFQGRGAGIIINDDINNTPADENAASNREWFIGSGYQQSVFNIGYAADGVNTSYAAQTKFSVGTTGNVNATGNITAQGNLIGVDGTFSGDVSVGDDLNVTDDAIIAGNLTVSSNTTLGNAVSDTTTVSGDFIAGNFGAADTNKLFFDTSDGRLGIGKLNPAYTVDSIGAARFSGDVISDGGQQGAQFTANFGTGKVMTLLHGSGYGVVGTTGATSVGIRTNNTDRIRITETGKVGIGTTTPNASFALTVNGGITTAGNYAQEGADFEINNSPRRTLTASGGDAINNDSENERRRALVHEFNDRLTINYSGDYTGGLRIGTKYQFENSGLVGIGTLSPDRTIHAYQSGGSAARLGLQVSNTTAESGIDFGDTGDLDVGRITYSHSNDYMSFFTNATKRLTIAADGKVGIGIATPSAKLTVAGEVGTRATVPQVQFIETNTGISPMRFRMDSGDLELRRSTSGTVGSFSNEESMFHYDGQDGNVGLGEQIIPNNQRYMYFINKATAADSYVHTRNELFHMGQANTFSFDGRNSAAYASFACTDSGTDITPFNSTDTNYKMLNSVGDGDTKIGIVLRRDAGGVGDNVRGGLIYGSRDGGGALLLNRNITGGTQIYFNNNGSRQALIATNKANTEAGANPFEIYTRTQNSDAQKKRIVVYKNGSILNLSQTYIHDESAPIDGDPSAVLHLRSTSSDHIRFENSNGSAHLATIDMDETNGLYIECNTSTATAQKIKLRPTNDDAAGVDIDSTGANVKGKLIVDGAIQAAGGNFDVDASGNISDVTNITASGTVQGNLIKGTADSITLNGGFTTIGLLNANTFIITVNATTDLFVQSLASTAGASYTFIIKNTGNFDINFSEDFMFVGGEPTLTPGNGKVDLMSFISDGTKLYGGISPNLTSA